MLRTLIICIALALATVSIAQEGPKASRSTFMKLMDVQEYWEEDRYDDAIALVTKTGQASISMIQRHLRVGYNRAARIIEVMEKEGVVGPSDGVKPREVLVTSYERRK